MKHTRILILRLSSIGDILLTTAFLRQVRTAFPSAQIDFVVKEQFSEILKHNPHIDDLYRIKREHGLKNLINLRSKLFKEPYDFVFDLHNNFRTKILTLGHRTGTINKKLFKRWLLVKLKVNRFRSVETIPEKYLRVGNEADIVDDGLGLEIFWDKHSEGVVDTFLNKREIKTGFTALAPGAMHFTKRWPSEYFAELIKKILSDGKQYILLLGSEKERPELDLLADNDRVINAAGKFSIIESTILLSRARVLVSNDSGLMHLATAVKIPVVAIFGSTVEELGFYPFRGQNVVVANENLYCRPCSHIGKSSCPKKHFKCMLGILPDRVYEEVVKISVDEL